MNITENFGISHEKDKNQQTGGGSAVGIIISVIWLILAITAAVFAWMANHYELTGMRVLYTIGAFCSGPFYLGYYLFVRVILGYEYDLFRQLPGTSRVSA
jgi:hypothetical protein